MKKIILLLVVILISMIFIVSSESEKIDVTISLKNKKILEIARLDDLEVTYKSDMRNVVSARVSKETLEKLQKDKNVLEVKPRLKLRTFLQDSTAVVNASLTWPIQVTGINLTGDNQTICIIDSGINYSHSAFGSCTREEILAGSCGDTR